MAQHDSDETNEKIVILSDPDMADLIPGYLENRWADTRTMMESLEQGDYEAIRILGHDMKGTGGGYGFDAISVIGESLEHAAIDQIHDEVRNLVQDLTAFLDRVEIVYMQSL